MNRWSACGTCLRRSFVIAVFLLPSCQQPSSRYPKDDALRKGEAFHIPEEFRKGTASFEQAKAWSNALLMGNGSIVTEEHELIPGDRPAIFFCDLSNSGTGGNSYMVFEQTNTGLRYLGEIDFGVCRTVPPDASNNPRLVTYWHMSADEGELTLWLLSNQGFVKIKSITIQSGDEGTGGGNRIFDIFFGPKPVKDNTIVTTFGAMASSR